MKDITEYGSLCGNTPLIKIADKIYGKLETYNPTGSVKDRMIYYVLRKALQEKLVRPFTILCEATSGNTGIALSAIAAKLGLRCVIFMPSNMSEERKQMMSVYGAELVFSSPSNFEEAIAMRDEFLKTRPNAWSPMQFSNPYNVECHRFITAPEIQSQVFSLGKKWSAFIHGSGTGGTIEGVRQYSENTITKVCMVVPKEEMHGIQGIGDGKDFLANPEDMASVITISTQDAVDRAKKFSRDTGLLVGISSGANILASERYVANNDINGIVVTMLCDRGERYMSIYGDEL